jgi:hypothetical protein
VIPAEVNSAPWHFTTCLDALDHCQTLIAGVLAFKQIEASREEADRVITATREQTAVAHEQIATTLRLERERVLSEDRAFHATLEAAMARVLAEAAWARKTYPQFFTEEAGSSHLSFSLFPSMRLSFANASPRARSQSCAPLASGGAAL